MRPWDVHYLRSSFILVTLTVFAVATLISQAAQKETPKFAQATPTPSSTSDEDAEVEKAKRELEAIKQESQNTLHYADERSARTGNIPLQVNAAKNQTRASVWSADLVCKLSVGIGVFAFLLLACVTMLLRQQTGPGAAEQILRTFGILVIIFASV